MNELRDRHRRWLDQQMPRPEQVREDLHASLHAARSSRASEWRWPVVMTAVAAAGVLVFLIASPPPSPELPETIDWGVSLALHVDGQPRDADVHIQIAIREQTP